MADIPFRVCAAEIDETLAPGAEPESSVKTLARRKAQKVAQLHPEACVIAADTLVVLVGEILGKPETPEQAADMLRKLSGREHRVYTGVCVLVPGQEIAFAEQTAVRFYSLTDAEIDAYVQTGEPMDKAGAYGIQGKGCVLVERIDGDFFNVMGLPIAKLVRVLREFAA